MTKTANIKSTPSFYSLIENDPTIPRADGTIGAPVNLGPPTKPFANLSDPDSFPEAVQDVIAAAPVVPRGMSQTIRTALHSLL